VLLTHRRVKITAKHDNVDYVLRNNPRQTLYLREPRVIDVASITGLDR